MALVVTVFPQPDSPTIPTTSPSLTSKLTLSTTRVVTDADRETDAQVLDGQEHVSGGFGVPVGGCPLVGCDRPCSTAEGPV